ncbi:ABATE domain-containing protein [Streptomyces sp. S07_1.15]|uniref:CGNR zinc finger domain-containing protein n=1 Tax=Streptomyces sp. S07_1.15 TaxID=2873925 RepID=UPI001D14DF7A|nr:ABATE domain-containing protein [Streptomyces sp. S07_1.15]MCC3654867.1 ABATE domain-containing protein [Streptomyces sp. S07_1.15]
MSRSATGLVLQARDGARFRFDPGALCLEFLTTGGPGPLSRFEALHGPRELAGWLALSRLGLDPGEIRAGPEDAAAGRRLRDALWHLARAVIGDASLPAGDLAEVNRAAAHPALVPRIAPDGTRAWAPPVTGAQALSSIARDAVELLTGPDAGRIRECGAGDCPLVFVDLSRSGRRRWCSMERCGNRHKVRALRARRDRTEEEHP